MEVVRIELMKKLFGPVIGTINTRRVQCHVRVGLPPLRLALCQQTAVHVTRRHAAFRAEKIQQRWRWRCFTGVSPGIIAFMGFDMKEGEITFLSG